MIPKECKRLAEVDFPIAVVSKHAVREKSGPPGYPSRLHIWWAHRPLAACRAMLLALLLPDPCDERCPGAFKEKARGLLVKLQGKVGRKDEDLRRALLTFIGDFANWDHSAHPTWLEVGQGLVKAAHHEETPLVVDPFAGRGSIPLEALRLGCDAAASELNPVACFVLKVLLEDIPRNGEQLAVKLQSAGEQIQEAFVQEIGALYPKDLDGAQPIAYLWARTVRCEAPRCGAEIPVYKSPWLARKGASSARYFKESPGGRSVALLIENAPRGGPITFRIACGDGSEDARPGFVRLSGTKVPGNSAAVVCPCCQSVLPGNKNNPRTRTQLASQRGGADVAFGQQGTRIGGATLLAVVTRRQGEKGQQYRLARAEDYEAVWNAHKRLKKVEKTKLSGGLEAVPTEPTPIGGGRGASRAFSVHAYGMTTLGDLFTARQKLALVVLQKVIRDLNKADPDLRRLLAAAFDRVAMSDMSCTRWNASGEKMQHTFGRQALPIVWDFAEVVPTADAPGNWESGYELLLDVVTKWPDRSPVGQVELADACDPPHVFETADVWFTDPPYYDSVPYADLSDFFFVWLKRLLPVDTYLRDPFDPRNPLTPKTREIVQDDIKQFDGHPKDKAFFEEMMGKSFAQGRQVLKDNGIGCVVFAHKTTEGWEALLSGMVQGGWTVTGSWPVATEMRTRLRARESAALGTSVHLICRPRPDNAPTGDWAEVLRELPRRVGHWMERLEAEGVRGADLVFACIGPALEIFSRYQQVETAEGTIVELAEYLERVWEVVGRTALQQVLGTAEARAHNSAAGALEEDARLTALFLWTLQATDENGQNSRERVGADVEVDDLADAEDLEDAPRRRPKGYRLIFDVVRRFAQPLGIHLDEWEGRIIETKKGVVRLLPIAERARQLFGEDGASAVAYRIESDIRRDPQRAFSFMQEIAPEVKPKRRGRGRKPAKSVDADSLEPRREATTLDRVHAAMLLQAGGQAGALRALLKAETDRSPDFLRLANALSALYPKGSEEKRLLDAMLLAVPR